MKTTETCEQIQRDLSVRAAPSEPIEAAVCLHLETCADCSAFLAKLERLEQQATAWQNSLPLPSLESRIAAALAAEAASMRNSSTRSVSRPRWSLFWLKENRSMIKHVVWGGAALLAVALLAAGHQTGQANTALNRMGEAAKKIKSVHLIGWNCELKPKIAEQVEKGGTPISVTAALPHRFEAWIQEGRWRESQDFDVTLYRQGKVWKNGVFVPQEKEPPLLTSFAFRAITADSPFGKAADGKEIAYTTQTLGEEKVNGQPALKILLESQKQTGTDGSVPVQERRLLWLNPRTYLPIRMEQMRYQHDRWGLDAVIWFDYDVSVSGALFDPQQVKTERHGAVDYTRPTARDLYRLTQTQYAAYTAAVAELDRRQTVIEAEAGLTRAQKDKLLVQAGAEHRVQLRQIMDADQQRLFDDWWYVQPKMMDKLATPQQRQEDARWRAEQQALMREWFQSLDEPTRKRLGSPASGNSEP